MIRKRMPKQLAYKSLEAFLADCIHGVGGDDMNSVSFGDVDHKQTERTNTECCCDCWPVIQQCDCVLRSRRS